MFVKSFSFMKDNTVMTAGNGDERWYLTFKAVSEPHALAILTDYVTYNVELDYNFMLDEITHIRDRGVIRTGENLHKLYWDGSDQYLFYKSMRVSDDTNAVIKDIDAWSEFLKDDFLNI